MDSLAGSESLVFAVAVRATVLLAAAVLLTLALRRRAAGIRHQLWTTTFVVLLAMPAVWALAPAWNLPLIPAGLAPGDHVPITDPLAAGNAVSHPETGPGDGRSLRSPELSPPAGATSHGQRDGGGASLTRDRAPEGATATGAAAPKATAPSASAFLALAWAIGCAAAAASVVVGSLRFHRLVRDGTPIRDHAWRRDVARLSLRLGIARELRLVTSPGVTTPMTGCWRRPVILVPESALEWTADRREVVLGHELVHVRRNDALRQIVCRTALALYWFNPLSWLAARLAAISREEACDEAVLELGTRPSEYATHLLDLAESMHRAPALASLPMIQRSQLERRVMAILAPRRPRPGAITTALALSLIVGLGVSAAIARPVATSAASPAGSPSREASHPMPPSLHPTQSQAITVTGTSAEASAGALPTQDMTCEVGGLRGNFSGSLTMSERDGGTRYEHSGWHNGDRIIQRYVDDLRLCVRIHGDVVLTDDRDGVRAIGSGGWVTLEAETESRLQRLTITEGAGGVEHSWSVNGREQTFDATAQEWRDRMFRVVDGYWEASRLRGQESSLRGQISSHRGQVSSLRGQISSHRGQVSSLRGQISSQRGQISSLEGQISSHRGHVSSLRGQISSLEGQISSLQSAARATSDNETRSRLENEIEGYRARIREVESRIEDYDLEGKIADVRQQIQAQRARDDQQGIQQQIEDYQLDAKVAEIQQQIDGYDLEGKIQDIERQIEELDADRRAGEIEERVEAELDELLRLIDRL